jgi:hypothetical protein
MWYNKNLKLKSLRPKVRGRFTNDPDKLLRNGWVPVVDIPPKYNPETQKLMRVGIRIEGDQAIQQYAIEQIALEVDRVRELRDYVDVSVANLSDRLARLEAGGWFMRLLKRVMKIFRR